MCMTCAQDVFVALEPAEVAGRALGGADALCAAALDMMLVAYGARCRTLALQ